jgi:hypothetical protein
VRDPQQAIALRRIQDRFTAHSQAARWVAALLVGIGIAALAVVQGRDPTSPDDALYRALASSLAAGRGYVDADWNLFTVRPPGFAAVLAPIMDLTSPGSRIPWFLQAGLGGVALGLLFALLQRWLGWAAAILATAAAILVPDIREMAVTLRPDVLAAVVLVAGTAATYRGITEPDRAWLVLGAVLLGGAVIVKETMIVDIFLPACLWAVVHPDPRRRRDALTATLAAAGIAWGWWVWVAISTAQAFPAETSGPVPAALVVGALPLALAVGAIAAGSGTRSDAGWIDGRPAGPSMRVLGFALAGLTLAIVLPVLLAGGAQQAVVGDAISGTGRFVRDRLVPQLGWLLPALALGAVSAVAAWRHGGPGIRAAVSLVVLSAPVWLLTAEGSRSLRTVAVPLLVSVGIAGWALAVNLRAFFAAPGRVVRSPHAVGAAAGIVALTVGLAVLPAHAPAETEPPDWATANVIRTAALVDRVVPNNRTVMVSWLYGNEIYARTRGAYRMPFVPTVLFRMTAGTLRPASSLYRFTPLTAEEREQRVSDLVWLRYVPSLRGYMGLSLPQLFSEFVASNTRALVLAGDSFQSTLDIAPVLANTPGVTSLAEFGIGRDALRLYEIDAATIQEPTAWPLFVNGPTLQQLALDFGRTGVDRAAIATAIDADRIVLVDPMSQADAALLASFRAGG